VIVFFFLLNLCSCDPYNRNQSHKQIPTDSVEAGETLAKKYCQSCHAFPQPSLLSVEAWEKGVLPNMGPRLGIFNHYWTQYPSMRRDPNLAPGVLSFKPL
jgi:hypothetical protein